MKFVIHRLLFIIIFSFFVINAEYVYSIVGAHWLIIYGFYSIEISWFIAKKISGWES